MRELYASDVSHIRLQRFAYGLGPLVTYLKERDIDCWPLFAAANIPPEAIGDPTAMMNLKRYREEVLSVWPSTPGVH